MDLLRKIFVTNRSRGTVVYRIPHLRVERIWKKPGDVLQIPIDELIEVTMIPGGKRILEQYLMISDQEVLDLIFVDGIVPEYRYGPKEIEYLLYTGTNEEFLDTLDYAPKGVLDLILAMSIKKLPDTVVKVEAINKKFNVNLQAIRSNATPEEEHLIEEIKTQRRTAPIEITNESETAIKPKVTYKSNK